ncbi:hypothetical protein ACQKJC_24640 [Priestia koreensis]|uniref:hypothetical protein n=1 Tax=Priestia koreensis TaxID=284581 RepID=UPI003CFD6DA7
MKATITGNDSLSKRILLELEGGRRVSEIPSMYPVSLDQSKRLSRYLHLLRVSEDNLPKELSIRVSMLGLKVLPLANLFKKEDWEGITEVLELVHPDITRYEVELLLKGLEEKRVQIQDFKNASGDDHELLEDEISRLQKRLQQLSHDSFINKNEIKDIKKQQRILNEKLYQAAHITPQLYKKMTEFPSRLSLDELKEQHRLKQQAQCWFYDRGYVVVDDFVLPNHRRIDGLGYNDSGNVVGWEVLTSQNLSILRQRGLEYKDFCDEFYIVCTDKQLSEVEGLFFDYGILVGTLVDMYVYREDVVSTSIIFSRDQIIFELNRTLSKRLI